MRNRIILAAAEEINFRGFKFTMSDLTKRLSISKSSLYEYFSSKNELIATVLDLALDDIQSQEEEVYNHPELSIAEKFQAILTISPKIFGPINDRIYEDLRNYYPAEWEKVANFRQDRLDRLSDFLIRGIAANALRPVNLKVIRQMISGAMNDLINYRFLADNNMTYPDAIAAMADVIAYGLIPRN